MAGYSKAIEKGYDTIDLYQRAAKVKKGQQAIASQKRVASSSKGIDDVYENLKNGIRNIKSSAAPVGTKLPTVSKETLASNDAYRVNALRRDADNTAMANKARAKRLAPKGGSRYPGKNNKLKSNNAKNPIASTLGPMHGPNTRGQDFSQGARSMFNANSSGKPNMLGPGVGAVSNYAEGVKNAWNNTSNYGRAGMITAGAGALAAGGAVADGLNPWGLGYND